MKRIAPFLFGLLCLLWATAAQAQGLTERQVIDLIAEQTALRAQVPLRDVEVEWLDMRLSSLVPAIPEGRVSLEIADASRLEGRGSVPVQILVNGQKFRTIFPRLDIRRYQKVLLSKVRIARGQKPDERDLEVKRQAVTALNGQPISSKEAIAGAEAIQNIPAGTVLTAQMFRLPPLIKAGQVVSVVLLWGEMTLITSAEARGAGAMGQVIKVMNIDSKREFTARVAGPDRVEVRMEEQP